MKKIKYAFIINWIGGCASDHIVKYLKENNINFYYNYFTLVADLYGNGQYFKFDYEHINGNTYGIVAIETENI